MRPIDYTKFGTSDQPDEGPFERRWWLLPKGEIPDAVSKNIKFLEEHQGMRFTQYRNSVRLYGNISLMGLNGLTYTRGADVQPQNRDRINYNVIQSGIDTIVSKIGKNKPKPFFLTQGGNYKIQRKAKKLNKFVDGIFYENKAYELGQDVLKDACVVGDGFIHVFDHYDRVKFERVFANELLVDDEEGKYGYPRSLYRVKDVDRQVLKDLYPSKAKAIEDCNNAAPTKYDSFQMIADTIRVRECWHLPSGPEAKDGIHTISIDGVLLFSEGWTKPYFPFARFTWNKRLYGYWGQGAAEQVQTLQLEIAKLCWVIQRSLALMGSFKIWVKNGSKIPKPHLNNDIGAIITGEEPPQYITPPPIQAEYFNRLDWLKNAAYEQMGISQLSATAQKPAGLNSGEALRTYNDIETERFMTVGQAYENFYLHLADLAINCAKDIYEKQGKYTVPVPGKKFIDSIDWSDIDLENDEYTMKVFPVSGLKGTPADNLQTIQEYMQAGIISLRTGRKLLDFPDLQQVEELGDAEEEYITMILEKMVDADPDSKEFTNAYTAPEGGFDDLQLALELVLQYYAEGKTGNLDERNLQLLRTFKSQVQGQLDMAAQAAAPMPPQAPGVPAAPPVSQLLPNTQGQAIAA